MRMIIRTGEALCEDYIREDGSSETVLPLAAIYTFL